MSNILVTGGAGFVGSNLAASLMSDHVVVVFDDFSLGSFENLQRVKFTGKVIKGDIMESNQLSKAIRDYKIEYVFHLAAHSNSQMFAPKTLKNALKTNVNGTLNVFEVARRNNIKRVVYASTSTLYATYTPPFKEDQPVTAQNFYALSKLINENMAQLYTRKGMLDTVGLRFFSIYGQNEQSKGKYGNVLTQFVVGMSNDEQPIIYGDGKQTRDFLHVKDLCAALKLAMFVPEAKGEILNIGTGIKTNFIELVKEINLLLGKDLKPKFAQNPIDGYVFDHQASTIKANAILDWKPTIFLEEGLKMQKEDYVESIVSDR